MSVFWLYHSGTERFKRTAECLVFFSLYLLLIKAVTTFSNKKILIVVTQYCFNLEMLILIKLEKYNGNVYRRFKRPVVKHTFIIPKLLPTMNNFTELFNFYKMHTER